MAIGRPQQELRQAPLGGFEPSRGTDSGFRRRRTISRRGSKATHGKIVAALPTNQWRLVAVLMPWLPPIRGHMVDVGKPLHCSTYCCRLMLETSSLERHFGRQDDRRSAIVRPPRHRASAGQPAARRSQNAGSHLSGLRRFGSWTRTLARRPLTAKALEDWSSGHGSGARQSGLWKVNKNITSNYPKTPPEPLVTFFPQFRPVRNRELL